jgi:hypothetical protein
VALKENEQERNKTEEIAEGEMKATRMMAQVEKMEAEGKTEGVGTWEGAEQLYKDGVALKQRRREKRQKIK